MNNKARNRSSDMVVGRKKNLPHSLPPLRNHLVSQITSIHTAASSTRNFQSLLDTLWCSRWLMSKRQQKFRLYNRQSYKKVCLMLRLLSILCGLVWLLVYNVTKGNTKPSSFKREGNRRSKVFPIISTFFCFFSESFSNSIR